MPAVSYDIEGDVAVLTIDNPPVNALSLPVRVGLMACLGRAAEDAQVKAVVVTGSRGSFAAGADIKEIASGIVLQSPITREVQARIESLTKPVIAALEGVALGGGFELALSCHYRIAGRSAHVGLPEVKLGLIPGAGGTQRFTRLAGPAAALEWITSGAQIAATRALELGLLDALAQSLPADAIAFARQVVAERRPLRLASELTVRIANTDPALFSEFRKKIESRARGQLAPWRIIDSIEAACTRPKDEAFRLRARVFPRVSRQPPACSARARVFRRARGASHPGTRRGCGAAADPRRCRRWRRHDGRRYRHVLCERRYSRVLR